MFEIGDTFYTPVFLRRKMTKREGGEKGTVYKKKLVTINNKSLKKKNGTWLRRYSTDPKHPLLQSGKKLTQGKQVELHFPAKKKEAEGEEKESIVGGVSKSKVKKEDTSIELFQQARNPQSWEFRVLLDYYGIPYFCIEVAPTTSATYLEMEKSQVSDEYKKHKTMPLLRIVQQKEVNATIATYKNEVKEAILGKDNTTSSGNNEALKKEFRSIQMLNDVNEFHKRCLLLVSNSSQFFPNATHGNELKQRLIDRK
ncbi:hypothetical protein RFI_23555, partial [Reticulomyxa filosa]